jgi:hypothetical protein
MCRRTIFILGAVLATTSLPRDVLACSCPPIPVCSSLWTADVVFVGLVTNVARPTPGTEMTRFSVEEWFRGERVGKEATIASYSVGGSCDRGFDEGKRYMVYANRRSDGSWRVDVCSATATVDRAAQDLKYVRDALAHPGPGALWGNAFIDVDPTEHVRSGPSIARAPLVLESGARRLLSTTDPQGQYRFERIPAGEYTLSSDLPSDLVPVPPKRIVIGKGACIMHTFWTTKR